MMKARLLAGLWFLAVGMAFTWYYTYLPLMDARRGAEQVKVYYEVVALGTFAIVYGLALLLGGARVWAVIRQPRVTGKQKLVFWGIAGLALLISGLTALWLHEQLSAWCYVDGSRYECGPLLTCQGPGA